MVVKFHAFFFSWILGFQMSCAYMTSVCHIPFSSVSEYIMVLQFEACQTVDYCWHLSLPPAPTRCGNMSHILQTKTLHQIFSRIWITMRQNNNQSECPVSHIKWWWQLFPIDLWFMQRPVQFDLLTFNCFYLEII